MRSKNKRSREPVELHEETIQRHLEGEITIGLYAIKPENQCCKWVAIDADYKDSTEDLLKLEWQLGRDGIQPGLEMSRRGGHLWIFFAEPLLARYCLIYIYEVALRLGVPVTGQLREGIEIFPR